MPSMTNQISDLENFTFTGECYKATCAYEATSNDEISFPVGAKLEILQKNLEGWWLAWLVVTLRKSVLVCVVHLSV